MSVLRESRSLMVLIVDRERFGHDAPDARSCLDEAPHRKQTAVRGDAPDRPFE